MHGSTPCSISCRPGASPRGSSRLPATPESPGWCTFSRRPRRSTARPLLCPGSPAELSRTGRSVSGRRQAAHAPVRPLARAVAIAVTGLRAARIGPLSYRGAERTAPDAGLLLGHDRSGRAITLDDRQLSAHGLILGASGAGKSTTLLAILTAQIQRGAPVIALDLKGSPAFARELRQATAAAGRRLRVWTPDGSERWNPLATGNATQLKDKLIATERFTEPHFQRAAERHLQLALWAMIATGQTPSLELVTRTLDPKRLGALSRALPPEQAAPLREYLASLTPDQLSAVRGLASRLAIITESHTGAYLSDPARDGIDLRRALAGEEVILFSLNSSSYGKL